jgi:integrating conjugative element protein (TIGR03759 family)
MLGWAPLSSGDTATQGHRIGSSKATQSAVRSTTDAASDERLAHDWGLEPQEWARYRQLMHGPLGVQSPNLDPLTALGVEARTADERWRIAERQVRFEARRAEKVLAYQRAYDEAWKRIYPSIRPLAVPAITAPNATATPDPSRLAVFVKDPCIPCEQRVKDLQAEGLAFDLYMVGSQQDDARIRKWAAKVGIDPAKVRAHTITLNHDAGRWLSLGGKGELPAVLRKIDGAWRRQ